MADSLSLKDFSPEDLKQLSPEELKFLHAQDAIANTPSPSPIEGTARAISQGAVGYPKEQPKDQAFANHYPIASSGGGMLGRAADFILPVLGGRYVGGKIAAGIRPTVNAERMGEQAFRRAYQGAPAKSPGAIKRSLGNEARDLASEIAAQRNQSADRMRKALTFTGGLTGGVAGGAGGAYLHGEDPETGALYGAGAGVLPAVRAAPVLSAGAGAMGAAAASKSDWPFILKLLGGEEAVKGIKHWFGH